MRESFSKCQLLVQSVHGIFSIFTMPKIQPSKYYCELYDHEGTRTLNLLIRSQTPYPLGHAVIPETLH